MVVQEIRSGANKGTRWWFPLLDERMMNQMADMMEAAIAPRDRMPWRFYMTPAVYWEVPDRPRRWHRLWAKVFLGWRWQSNDTRI